MRARRRAVMVPKNRPPKAKREPMEWSVQNDPGSYDPYRRNEWAEREAERHVYGPARAEAYMREQMARPKPDPQVIIGQASELMAQAFFAGLLQRLIDRGEIATESVPGSSHPWIRQSVIDSCVTDYLDHWLGE